MAAATLVFKYSIYRLLFIAGYRLNWPKSFIFSVPYRIMGNITMNGYL